ncbi:hypothetical protein BG004_001296 [Podila humilis]|nr:hypothetical protein BG004_001296 [Podila humilis]
MATQPPKTSLHPNASSAALSEALTDPGRKFTLTYWDIASVGSTAREILSYGKADWVSISPTFEQWSQKEFPTPLSYLPVLKVRSSTGLEVTMAEAMVIDDFLAEQFGLLGDNTFEKVVIKSFYSSIHFLRERTIRQLLASGPNGDRKKDLNDFIEGPLRKFLRDHAFHLENNGNNGHYVGDKISLADIHLSNVIHFYQTFPQGKTFEDVFREYSSVWKVHETVLTNPEIAAWHESNEFKRLEDNSKEWYKRFAIPDVSKEE